MFKGFENLANFAGILRQAQQMGGKMKQLQEELKTRRVEGTAGGGMVTVEVNGAGEVLSCRIDPSLFNANDREMVEDLIPAAVNQALNRCKEQAATAMQQLTGGLDVPGLNSMLAQLTGGEPQPPTT